VLVLCARIGPWEMSNRNRSWPSIATALPAVLDLDSGIQFCGRMTAKGAGRYGQGLIRLGKARTATWTLA
jgi:hypothetical protein